jgi:hypothetical protein
MKKPLLTLLGVMVMALAFSQDLVVTVNRDSIACKVVGFSDDSLFYTMGEPGKTNGMTAKRYALHQADVFVYKMNYQNELAAAQQEKKLLEGKNWKRIRLAANLGVSYQLDPDGNSGGDLVVPNDEMYLSVTKGADVAWFFSPNWGVGLTMYQYNTAKIYDYDVEVQELGHTYLRNVFGEDRLLLTYFGPLLIRKKQVFKDQTSLTFGFSVGRVLYDKEKTSSMGDYHITGKTFGGLCEFGLESRVNKSLSFGIKTSLFAGWINNRTWDDGHTSVIIPVERIDRDLHRLDISVGVRVYL